MKYADDSLSGSPTGSVAISNCPLRSLATTRAAVQEARWISIAAWSTRCKQANTSDPVFLRRRRQQTITMLPPGRLCSNNLPGPSFLCCCCHNLSTSLGAASPHKEAVVGILIGRQLPRLPTPGPINEMAINN